MASSSAKRLGLRCTPMDEWLLAADVLWTGFALCLVASAASVLLARRGRRDPALMLLFIAVLGILASSYVGGFSIGRFTAAIPVLFIAYLVGMGRGGMVVAGCLVAAAALYVVFSWLLTPLVFAGGPLAVIFGAWGIPAYLVFAIAGFSWSLANPPRGSDAMVR